MRADPPAHHPEIGDIPLNKLTQNVLQQFYGRLKKSGRKRFTDKYGEGLSDRMVVCVTPPAAPHWSRRCGWADPCEPGLGCTLPPKNSAGDAVLTREEMQSDSLISSEV